MDINIKIGIFFINTNFINHNLLLLQTWNHNQLRPESPNY